LSKITAAGALHYRICFCRGGKLLPFSDRAPAFASTITRRSTTMTKLSLLGVAAVAAYAALAVPAIAQHKTTHINAYAQTDRCTHDAGNPYSKEEDYMAWSGWRARGGWDDRPDANCGRTSSSGF
jgi:hypothetical protein